MVTSSLEQFLVDSLNSDLPISLSDSPDFKYQSVFINQIVPDERNPRYLPSIMLSNTDAEMFVKRKITKLQLVKAYDAENNILYGKDCFINCLKHGTSEWKKANETIESILELARNIAVSEVIQVPTIYPAGDKYKILTGHRRFYALVYVKGINFASQFKVYNEAPLLKKIKQFQENASREDLPQYGKLSAFTDAKAEVEALNQARLRVGMKKLTVREQVSILGISMGAFDNYNVLTRYPCVIDAYFEGLTYPFVRIKKMILKAEDAWKEANNKSILEITDRRQIDSYIRDILFNRNQSTPSKSHSFKMKPINTVEGLRRLLTVNVLELDTDIDWEHMKWDDLAAVNEALERVIQYINEQHQPESANDKT